MTTATHESDLIALSTTTDSIAPAAVDATEPSLGSAPPSKQERANDFEVEIVIQMIASRILGAALLERVREVDSIAT